MLAWLLQTAGEEGGEDHPAAPGEDGEAGATAAAEAPEATDGEGVEAEAVEQPAEPQLAVDAAQSLGGVAETLHESTVGQVVDDVGGPVLWGITALEWCLGIGAVLLAIIVRQVALVLLRRFLRPLVQRTETEYDDRILDQLRRAVSIFVLLGGFILAFSFIRLPSEPVNWQAGVWHVLHTLIIFSVALLGYRVLEIVLHFISHGTEAGRRSQLDNQFFPLLRDIAKFVIIVLAVIAVIQGWGYSASGILAGVGIGGLALAFAAQDTIANVFGSFVIYSDRPYKVGDWIKMGGVEGTVEEIGIRSTRVRCFDKTMVLVPNKKVANEDIQNFSEMPKRRLKLTVGLSYEATADQIEAIVNETRNLLGTHPGIDQEYWLVNFTDMSDYSLDMMVYCFTTTTVWKEYLDIRQDVLLNILEICDRQHVEIAFPTQTIYYRGAGKAPYAAADDPALPLGGGMQQPRQDTGAVTGQPRAEFNAAEGENGGDG